MEHAMEALRAFTTSIAEHQSGVTGASGFDDVPLRVSIAPPAAYDEFLHEQALGFLFADETKVVRQLQLKCEEGRRLAVEIYCARGCARAFPVVACEPDSAQHAKLYRTMFTVLQPQVAKLKMLSDFCSQTVVLLSDNIQRITVHENTTRVIPDILVDALLDMLDVLMQLNQLHDSKSSLRNDFSVFKRAFTHVREEVEGAEQIEEIQRLQEFVGQSSQSKSSIWDSLRHNLTNVKRFDQVVFFLVKRAVWHLDNGLCVASEEKFKYIRVLPCMLSVLEEDGSFGKKSAFQGPERKTIDAAMKILVRFPVVPLFAELNMKPMMSLRSLKTEQFGTASAKQDKLFDLKSVSASMKVACQEYIARLLRLTNLLTQGKISPTDKDEVAQLYNVVLEGLRYLATWKCSVLLFVSSKYQAPSSNEQLHDFGSASASPFFEYERVTKYNYSAAELTAMAEIISSIKSIAQGMQQIQAKLVPYIRCHVYNALQTLVQHSMIPILHRADKRKLVCTKILHDLRLVCGDWETSTTVLSDFKKKRKERVLPGLSERVASPTLCQLQMVRTLVDSIYAKRSMGDLNAKYPSASSLFSLKKDLNSCDIEMLQSFYRDSSVFPAMLEFDDTLDELANFSSLWFRELYLEICKCPQFPVESSLPWLLVEHCLHNVSAVGVQSLLSVLDVYNDTANRCLYEWRQQFLYDEVEREGSLRFEQFVISMSSQVYAHYKRLAVRYELDNDQSERRCKKNHSEALDNEALYDCVLKKACVSVVGEQHNLSCLIGQHIHSKLAKDLAKWISRMETSDANLIIEHSIKLKTLARAHAMMSVALRMDSFEDMKRQATNELFSLESSAVKSSRVYVYVNRIVLHRLCHCFGVSLFSRRFVRIALPDVLASLAGNQSEKMKGRLAEPLNCGASVDFLDSFESATGLQHDQDIFGLAHMEALITMLSYVQVLELANDCVAFIQAKIEDVLDMCIEALGSAIPPFRLPRFMYRTEGCFGYFEGKFKHLFDSEELEAHIFHCLREIGNALFFLLILNDAMDVRLLADDYDSALPHGQKAQSHLFELALEKIHEGLQDSGVAEEWHASVSSHPEQTDNPSCFYRVWIALEFASCNASGKFPPRQQFGDGVQFAGCTMLHLLNQRPLYELWNASQHVVNVFEHERAKAQASKAVQSSHKVESSGPSSPVSANQLVGALGQEMRKKAEAFTSQAVAMRKTSLHVFHILETTRPNQSSEATLATAFAPPAFVPPPKKEQQQPTATDKQQTNATE